MRALLPPISAVTSYAAREAPADRLLVVVMPLTGAKFTCVEHVQRIDAGTRR